MEAVESQEVTQSRVVSVIQRLMKTNLEAQGSSGDTENRAVTLGVTQTSLRNNLQTVGSHGVMECKAGSSGGIIQSVMRIYF